MGSNRFTVPVLGCRLLCLDLCHYPRSVYFRLRHTRRTIGSSLSLLVPLYVLVGLYLFTPILIIVIAHAERKMLKYFVILWILGAFIMPLPTLFGECIFDVNVFIISSVDRIFCSGQIPSDRAGSPQDSFDFFVSWINFDCSWHLPDCRYFWGTAYLLLSRLFQPNSDFSLSCAIPAFEYDSGAFRSDRIPPPQNQVAA